MIIVLRNSLGCILKQWESTSELIRDNVVFEVGDSLSLEAADQHHWNADEHHEPFHIEWEDA
jgi:hypothetical protein